MLPKGVGYEYHLKTALESALFELMVSGGSINDKILVTGCPKSMLFSPKVQWNKSYCWNGMSNGSRVPLIVFSCYTRN